MSEQLLAVLAGVGGYALGTLQILLIDWVRRRREHRKNLRSLRAEIERALTLGEKFRWENGIEEDTIPKPPEVSPAFADLVISTEFYLTDEFEGDNAQKVMLTVLDGIDVLGDTLRQIKERIDRFQDLDEDDEGQREQIAEELVQLAESYDGKIGRFQSQLESCLEDIDRRLEQARYPQQICRQFSGLPEGENPEPLKAGDLGLSDSDAPVDEE